MISNGQARPIQKISNHPISFESNRDVRFEFESNLEASQVPNIYMVRSIPDILQ